MKPRINCGPLTGGGRSWPALTDDQLKAAAKRLRQDAGVVETFALAAVIAERVLGLHMFDVQILGALALQRGEIAEMQTGEGKTLAAVPAVIWYALQAPRRTCANGQRLPRSPRRQLDARDLRLVRTIRRHISRRTCPPSNVGPRICVT